MPVTFQKLLHQARVIEITSNQLVLEQQKDRHGVCIIPEKQHAAACAILLRIGRGQPTEISGSKRDTLRYTFSPPLTEAEHEHLENW